MNDSKRSKSSAAMGLMRVALLLIVALLLVIAGSVKASVAQADDAMLQLGRHLLALSESGIGNGERGVLINGQELGFRVFTVDQEVASALDFYENWCHGQGGDFPGQEHVLAGLDHSPKAKPSTHSYSWKDLVLRHEDEELGMVACLKHGLADPTEGELSERLLAFLEDGNLRSLGQFHYATATRVGDVTRVVAVWTEGDFFPFSMFPATGDAPGFDPANISRPPSGRRMLSAGEFGHQQTLAVYLDLEEDLPSLARFYRLDFVRHGWRLLSDDTPNQASRLLVVQRGNEMRVVSLNQEPGEAASVTIASTR